jgi:hypothetical protein
MPYGPADTALVLALPAQFHGIDKNDQAMILAGINDMLFQSDRSGARWQVEFTSRTSYNGGTTKAAGTTKFRDNRIWFHTTFGL